jgi:hypothetical protein
MSTETLEQYVMTTLGGTVRFVDTTLPHQLTLHWASASKSEVYGKCNCGWVGLRRRPEVIGTLEAHVVEYEAHL